jgi:hypothetical protein
MRKTLIGLVLLSICFVGAAQQTLDNAAVIKLSKAGLSDDLIITTINASPCHFDASTDGLIALKTAKVSDKVVSAIVLKANGAAPTAAPATGSASGMGMAPAAATGTAGTGIAPADSGLSAAAGSPATGPNGLPAGIDDVGVYLKDQTGAWVPMLPEIVNFQSTGKLKDIATAGIVKSALDGRIEGSRSKVNATLPVVFAVYLPETVEITEYTLLRLHTAADTRTFLSAAGGLLHTQAGAQRDEVEFQPEKMAPRLYQVTVPVSTGKGEYGLLAPGSQSTSNKETSGKIYTVSVAE